MSATKTAFLNLSGYVLAWSSCFAFDRSVFYILLLLQLWLLYEIRNWDRPQLSMQELDKTAICSSTDKGLSTQRQRRVAFPGPLFLTLVPSPGPFTASSGISSHQLFLTVPRLPPAPLKRSLQRPVAFPAGPVQPPAFSYASEPAAWPLQNLTTSSAAFDTFFPVPVVLVQLFFCSWEWPFQPPARYGSLKLRIKHHFK